MKPFSTPSKLKSADQRLRALERLAALLLQQECTHPLRVAVDGVDAAGKTCLADELAAQLAGMRPVIRATLDAFHRPRKDRYRLGPHSALGYYQDSFDYPAFIENLLQPLGPKGNRLYRLAVFDYRLEAPVESQPLRAAEDAILLLDGIFLLRPELAQYWDFSIFVKVDFPTSLKRALIRAGEVSESGRQPEVDERERLTWLYMHRYIPGQKMYLEESRPEELADVVWDNNDLQRPRLEVRAGGG